MYAMMVHRLDGPDALERVSVDPREPGEGEVRVATRAIGCNFFDLLITRGKYQKKPELPFAPGGEAAGVVDAVGPGVEGLAPGDRVLALLEYGAYATHFLAPAERVLPIPDAMGFDEAAALGVVYQTSHVALVHRANLRAGETLLVHAAAGGVGLAALQIGAARGAKVIGTAGSDEKLALARAHGASHAFTYRDDRWLDEVLALTDGRGADVVYDPVGGDAFDLSTRGIAFGGRILVIGFASGRIPEMRMNRVLLKNISLVGLHWGEYFRHDPQVIRDAHLDLCRMWARGEVRPLVSETYPLEEAVAALAALAGRRTTGKVVLHP